MGKCTWFDKFSNCLCEISLPKLEDFFKGLYNFWKQFVKKIQYIDSNFATINHKIMSYSLYACFASYFPDNCILWIFAFMFYSFSQIESSFTSLHCKLYLQLKPSVPSVTINHFQCLQIFLSSHKLVSKSFHGVKRFLEKLKWLQTKLVNKMSRFFCFFFPRKGSSAHVSSVFVISRRKMLKPSYCLS